MAEVRRLKVPRPSGVSDEALEGFGLWWCFYTLTNPTPPSANALFSLVYAGPLFGPAFNPPDGTQLTLDNVAFAQGGSALYAQYEIGPFEFTGPDYALSGKLGATSVIVDGGVPTLQSVAIYLQGPAINQMMELTGSGGPNNAQFLWNAAGSTIDGGGTWTVLATAPLPFVFF
jgi:hypothetical protein